MKAIDFPGASQTIALSPVQRISLEQHPSVSSVSPARVWTDGTIWVTLWRPTFQERLSVLFFGRVWVSVLSGPHGMPPVAVSGCLEFFKCDPRDQG